MSLYELVSDAKVRKALESILSWCEGNISCRNCGGKDFTRKGDFVYVCNRCGHENVFIGFRWSDVGIPPHILNKLVLEGVLMVSYRSNSGTFYMLRDPEAVREALEASSPEKAVPPDLFDEIYGYDDLKQVLLRVARGDKIHVLLIGSPASGKSLFLHALSRLPGTYLAVAGTSTGAGIRDILIDYEPKILLIDELDKCQSAKDLSVLLSAMDPGVVVVTQHGRKVYKRVDVRVVAAANSALRIPNELLSRFLVFRLKPYDDDTLKRVIVHTLVVREGVKPSLARYVAKRVVDDLKCKDVRKAILIARASRDERDVDFLISTMRRYGPGPLGL